MKPLRSKFSNPELAASIMRNVERLACNHGYTVPNGWRAIVELQCGSDEVDMDLTLDLQSNKGGGNYAEAKMAMLNYFRDLAATGLESPAAFAQRIREFRDKTACGHGDVFAEDYNPTALKGVITDRMLEEIAALDGIEQMPATTAERLREYGLTAYKGAIRAPYEIMVANDDGSIKPIEGEIRISFSGCKEDWQDLFMIMDILANLQHYLNKLWATAQVWYNLHELEKNHQTKLWLDLFGINETV